MKLQPFHRRPRGSALLFVVIMLAVLAIVGLAVISQANAESDVSSAKRQYDRSVACADAAREMLMSQFRLFNSPTSLVLDATLDQKRVTSSHYDPPASVSVSSITAAGGSTSGSMGISDMSNRIVRAQLGGQLYRITVVCSSAGNTRQSEVEFLVRYGL